MIETQNARCVRSPAHTPSPNADLIAQGTCQCVDCLVLDHLSLARTVAMRYGNRGVDTDDLLQVARLGLVLAAQRFDPSRGAFVPYALPTIAGEVRRYFRDATWDVRVPRRIQELIRRLRDCRDATQELGHHPSDAALAHRAGVTLTDLRDARQGAVAYRRQSLDQPGQDEQAPLAEVVPQAGNLFDDVDNLESLLPAVRQLDPRDARILHLRFYGDLTQAQIAQQIGVSQMHVSRLLVRILKQLRNEMESTHDGSAHSPLVPAPRQPTSSPSHARGQTRPLRHARSSRYQ
jgi:RNA polymerase sigma-B factor